tara:strand:+ start:1490 stop:1990 length:501 start_codon:yes stop_codon:yes gene_type:complete
MDKLPPLHIVVEDAVAMGYETIVLIVDHGNKNMIWCANTGEWNEDIDLASIRNKAWREAMEKIHGGEISSMEQIEIEEAFYSGELTEGISDCLERSHDTWHDPKNPEAVVDEDSACYCGWLGIDPPEPEFAPPGCSCVENIDPNHGHDIGWITFQEKKMADEEGDI